jgi:pantothenate kinase
MSPPSGRPTPITDHWLTRHSDEGESVTLVDILTHPTELAAWLSKRPEARIVGIVGPPGSGKSTVARELPPHLTGAHCVVPMDGFHYPQETLRVMGRRDRMGAKDTFDTKALAHLLARVSERLEPVVFPEFDRTIEEPIPGSITVMPEDELVIVEGNYLLVDDVDWARIGELLDLCLYVDIPEDVRLQRLTKRHVDFGKSPSDATEWVARVDQANARVIEATKVRANALYQPML